VCNINLEPLYSYLKDIPKVIKKKIKIFEMGMYTEFIINAKLKENTPIEIIECIDNMVNFKKNKTFTYESNPIKNYCKNEMIDRSFKDLHLKAHGSIKNYHNDIERFVDFIKPHIEKGFLKNGAFSKSRYEEFEYKNWDFYFV